MAYLDKFNFEIPGASVFSDLVFNKNRNMFMNGEMERMMNLGQMTKLMDIQRKNVDSLNAMHNVMMNLANAFATRQTAINQEAADYLLAQVEEFKNSMANSQTPEVRLSEDLKTTAKKLEKAINDSREMLDIATRASNEIVDIAKVQMNDNILVVSDLVREAPLQQNHSKVKKA